MNLLTAASDPLLGSVKQKAANFSPVASYERDRYDMKCDRPEEKDSCDWITKK